MQRALTDFGIDDSFERARLKVLEHYGLDLGRDSGNGEQALHYIDERLRCTEQEEAWCPPAQPVAQMLAELDGSEARTGKLVPIEGSTARTPVRKLRVRKRVTEWRDVRVGLVRPLHETTKSYIASLSSLDASARDLLALARLRGADEQTQFIKVIDGGPGLREAMDRAMDGPTILDRPHFHHQLFETADAMGVTADQRAQTVMGWSRTAASGQVTALIAFLSYWRPPDWTEADEAELAQPRGTVKLPHEGLDRARKLVAHLKRFEDAVAYDAFREQGFPVGSGEVVERPSHPPPTPPEEARHLVAPRERRSHPRAAHHPAKRLVGRLLVLTVAIWTRCRVTRRLRAPPCGGDCTRGISPRNRPTFRTSPVIGPKSRTPSRADHG